MFAEFGFTTFKWYLQNIFPDLRFFSVRQIYGRVIYLRFFFCKADLWQIYYFLFRSVCVIWLYILCCLVEICLRILVFQRSTVTYRIFFRICGFFCKADLWQIFYFFGSDMCAEFGLFVMFRT